MANLKALPAEVPRRRAPWSLGTLALMVLVSVVYPQTAFSQVTSGTAIVPAPSIASYEDSRPAARYRLDARDQGVILRHGGADEPLDIYGARDVWVFKYGDTYFLHYDAAGPEGWLTSLATSKDLVSFTKRGPALKLGLPGALDSASASYGTTYFDGAIWRMFYLGTQTVSPAPDLVPLGPYYILMAKSGNPGGPWIKEGRAVLTPKSGTNYDLSVSPGVIEKVGDEYLQFVSTGMRKQYGVGRTIVIARTKNLDGPWSMDSKPILPIDEQIENASLYFQESSRTWFMFVDHVALQEHQEYTDAIWVYWTQEIERWDPKNKAIVLDGSTSSWSKIVIGLPSVLPVHGKLAVFYDGLDAKVEYPNGWVEHTGAYRHMFRDIGVAWLDLPIKLPVSDNGSFNER